MKRKTVVGGWKIVPGPKQTEARTGRDENRRHKQRFKAGAFAKTDRNAGRPSGPLLTPHQNATPRKNARP